ncbi:hypothetical protein Avbf_00069 [Armadillidium vulgare]|nr:hypothetical protein Avbf_00069 [Armadillidium vulgare]
MSLRRPDVFSIIDQRISSSQSEGNNDLMVAKLSKLRSGLNKNKNYNIFAVNPINNQVHESLRLALSINRIKYRHK